MRKIIIISILTFISFTLTTKAQNHYLKISNNHNTEGRLVIPNNPAININATEHKTITFRIMIPPETNNTSNAKIMQKNNSAVRGKGTYGIIFSSPEDQYQTDVKLVCESTAPANYNTNSTTISNLKDGNWHHFAYVFNDNNYPTYKPAYRSKIYLDGILILTAKDARRPIDMSNPSDLIFGDTATGNSNDITIAIDDIRIWDRALTSDEVNMDRSNAINNSTAFMILGLLAAYDFEKLPTPTLVPDITAKTVNANIVIDCSNTAIVTGSSTVVK